MMKLFLISNVLEEYNEMKEEIKNFNEISMFDVIKETLISEK